MNQVIAKPWGEEEILEINQHYCLKKLIMRQGCCCSLQYHDKKVETIYVVSGWLKVQLEDREVPLCAGSVITIPSGAVHRMRADETTVYLEASTPEMDDVVRLEDKYGRTTCKVTKS